MLEEPVQFHLLLGFQQLGLGTQLIQFDTKSVKIHVIFTYTILVPET